MTSQVSVYLIDLSLAYLYQFSVGKYFTTYYAVNVAVSRYILHSNCLFPQFSWNYFNSVFWKKLKSLIDAKYDTGLTE